MTTVLVTGTDDWAIDQAVNRLRAAGVEVRRCYEPGEQPFPCNAFRPGRGCPVEQGVDVVLTVRARPIHFVSQGEIGVVCGAREGIPVVVAGSTNNHPFAALEPVVVHAGGDVVSACELAAAVPAPRRR